MEIFLGFLLKFISEFSFAGVFVLGPGNQGILYEHREMEFGDHYDSTLLLEAVDKIKSATEETI